MRSGCEVDILGCAQVIWRGERESEKERARERERERERERVPDERITEGRKERVFRRC